MKTLDIVIIGAGIAGITCGIRLLNMGNHNFMIYEKGRSYKNRYCAVDHGKPCTNCGGICNVISGFGGCIHYGDSVKLSVYPSGKRLYHLLGENEYESCLKYVLAELFKNCQLEFIQTEGKKITTMDVKDYGICSLNSDMVKEVLQNSFSILESNHCISMETLVEKVEKRDKGFCITLRRESGKEKIFAERVVIATGRDGLNWWKDTMNCLGVESTPPVISLGLRFEMDKKYLVDIGEVHPDLKLRFVKNGRKFKTFCFCAGKNGGKLKNEKYENFTLLDGHILMEGDEDGRHANFALLMQLAQDGEKETSPQILSEYIECYRRLSEDTGIPIYQNYFFFKRREEHWEANGTSLPSARPASVWKLLGSKEHESFCEVADEIFRWIMEMNRMKPEEIEDFERKIYVLGLEVESLWDTVLIDQFMMTTVEGLYVTGDCAGLAQGIMSAAVSGAYVANQLQMRKKL